MKSIGRTIVLFILFFVFPALHAQSFRSLNNKGVDEYENRKYSDAEINLRKAAEVDSTNYKANYNLGSAYAKQKKYDESIQSLSTALNKAKGETEKSNIYYNLGNAHMGKQEYQSAIDSYKNALKLRPDDRDAKYNLSYALTKLRQQQQQQKKDNKQQDKKDDNKDKNQNDKDKKDQKDKQNKDNQQNRQKEQDKQQQQKQQAQPKPKIAKEEAKRILETMKNNEQDLQKKLRQKAAVRVQTEKDW